MVIYWWCYHIRIVVYSRAKILIRSTGNWSEILWYVPRLIILFFFLYAIWFHYKDFRFFREIAYELSHQSGLYVSKMYIDAVKDFFSEVLLRIFLKCWPKKLIVENPKNRTWFFSEKVFSKIVTWFFWIVVFLPPPKKNVSLFFDPCFLNWVIRN